MFTYGGQYQMLMSGFSLSLAPPRVACCFEDLSSWIFDFLVCRVSYCWLAVVGDFSRHLQQMHNFISRDLLSL
jgi:hypothetical protein